MLFLISLLIGSTFASINDCMYLNNGTYCSGVQLITCSHHQKISAVNCPIGRSNGCQDILSCKCLNNWKGTMCNECPVEKVCKTINVSKKINSGLEWWEILLIVFGVFVAVLLLYFIGVGLYMLCTLKLY